MVPGGAVAAPPPRHAACEEAVSVTSVEAAEDARWHVELPRSPRGMQPAPCFFFFLTSRAVLRVQCEIIADVDAEEFEVVRPQVLLMPSALPPQVHHHLLSFTDTDRQMDRLLNE